jgi:GNAT superfamily N-acetyltransferase
MPEPRFVVAPLELPVPDELVEACREFQAAGGEFEGDGTAEMVDSFFPDGCIDSIKLGIGTTHLLLQVVDGERPQVAGYVSVGVDGFKLSGRERKELGASYSTIGAVRIGMIGVDHRHHRGGHGTALLKTAIGLANKIAETIPTRFLIADVNPTAEAFYVRNDFVPMGSAAALQKNEETGTIGMRLDLFETVSEDETPGV